MDMRQFLAQGVVYPRGHPKGPSQLRAECLIEGIDPCVDVNVRFLQIVERQILDAAGEPTGELNVTGHSYSSGIETVEREVRLASLPNRTAAIKTAGSAQAELRERGAPAGTLVRRWEPLHATVEAWSEEIGPGLRRVQVEVANRLEWDGSACERTPMRELHATHLIMHSPDGAFASLADPPPKLRQEAAACQNEGLWPVPVGEAGDRRTILASPVVLEDYPQLSVAA